MTPRPAGLLAMSGAAVLAIGGGYLLATPPWSIPGAVVLVAATILFAVGAVWMNRRSWSEPWPPDLTPSLKKQLQRARVLQVVNAVLVVAMIAAVVFAVVSGQWPKLVSAVPLLVFASINFFVNRAVMRRLRESDEAQQA
jgi:membrane protein implicated in regulation of membrane protease activity